MHIDARTLPNGHQVDADLCIVGAGAAGIPIALEFIGAGKRVVLLEGGGFDREDALQALYRGSLSGLPYFPLEAARLHYFGGSTGHWGGYCAPLDPVDFTTRSWVPGSGWPITRDALDPFYAKAHPLLDLGPYQYDPAWWVAQDARREWLPLDRTVLHEKIWQFSAPTRFGSKFRRSLEAARDVTLYTHANVTALEMREDGASVNAVRVSHFDGRAFTVRAATFVLAASTIQNVRLLLASTAHNPQGVGNAYDQVGRGFMEHLEMPAGSGVLLEPQSMRLYRYDFGVTRARAELALTPAAQERLGTLNVTVAIEGMPADGEPRTTFENNSPEDLEEYRRETRDSLTTIMKAEAQAHDAASVRAQPRVSLVARQEQAPNQASRVTITRERDALGVPRADFHWALTPLDRHSLRTMYLTLGREFARRGIGRVQLRDWLRAEQADWPPFVSGGWHDLGALRMSASPRTGVVDANCQVHGVPNLFIAGGGVFATAGAANPTLTIVALSLRLAAFLKAL